MKKLYKSLLILLVVLLTGCSLKGSNALPVDDNAKEPSQLQTEVEDFVSSETDLQEKVDAYQKAIEEVLNNINSGNTNEVNE